MSFKEKYLKYKSKYLSLKNQIGGSNLVLTNGSESIELNNQEAIALELKLNTSKYGHEWKHIGDALYNFGTNKANAVSTLTVTSEQLNFLKTLLPQNKQVSSNNYNTSQQKTNNNYKASGELTVGDRVREHDSQMTGTIIEIHDRWGHTNAVMKGDNGQRYEHALWHFEQI